MGADVKKIHRERNNSIVINAEKKGKRTPPSKVISQNFKLYLKNRPSPKTLALHGYL